MLWRATEKSIRDSVRNAMMIVDQEGYASVAFPIIGAGSGSFNRQSAKELMLDEFSQVESETRVLVVEFDSVLERQVLHKKSRQWICGSNKTNQKRFGPCECCGNMSRSVWGWIHSDERTLAAYFIQWTESNPNHYPNFDFIIGPWGDNSDSRNRVFVAIEYMPDVDGGSFRVIESSNRPNAKDVELHDRNLPRDEVINRPIAKNRIFVH